MMSEYVVLLITSYLYTQVILLPLLLASALLDPKKLSLAAALSLHKLVVVLTVALPLALFLIAVAPVGPSAVAGNPSMLPGLSEAVGTAPDTSDAAASAASSGSGWAPANELRTVNDVVYFYGGLVGWFATAGLLAFAFRYGLQILRVRHLMRRGRIVETHDGTAVVMSAAVPAPFSIGCVRKRIVLPGWLQSRAAEVIIRHELNHFACNHHRWSILEALLAHIFWFNPVSHWLRKRGDYLRELECDQATTRDVDTFTYARILVDSAEQIVSRRIASLGGHAWVDRNRLKARIDFILGEPKTVRRHVTRSLVLVAASVAIAGAAVVGNINDRFLQDEILETINREYAATLESVESVHLDDVPADFVEGMLVYYDPAFYRHDGVTFFRRSSITQQLAKSFLRVRDRTIRRKIREMKVARVLESNFSKDEILEMHLNRTFWGNRAHGLASAARTYFGKPYTELTRSESAMLVPFLEAPSLWNSRRDPETATRRQQELLGMMEAVRTGI